MKEDEISVVTWRRSPIKKAEFQDTSRQHLFLHLNTFC